MKRVLAGLVFLGGLLLPTPARADDFPAGSLIIPMDTTYQNQGMLRAYGLVYDLLRKDVPVNWVIRKGKAHLGVDFTASGNDFKNGAPINAHGYRGGPWVIHPLYAAAAGPIITAWQAANPAVTVHVTNAAFTADVAKQLVVAPTIAMYADGNQKIARKYMIAAGIPDSTLDYGWPDTSPDMLDPNEVAGPTTSSHEDGKLFDNQGAAVYCQFMSMHWGVNDAVAKPEVVAEVRQFLGQGTHFFAECQAVNAYENGIYGKFLTPNGFLIGNKPGTNVDFYNSSATFAQIDGPFESVGGSEPSYSLPPGDSYKAGGVVMITEKGTPEGINDVWMTGFLDGACPPWQEICGSLGKVSYLGGHEYDVSLPITGNPKTQGTRLFLNSLFDSGCATVSGQPQISVFKTGPATTTGAQITYTLTYWNSGPGIALDAKLTDPIPAGSTFVSATGGGTFSGGTVTWLLGNLGIGESGSVDVTVSLSAYATYQNTAKLDYRVGLNWLMKPSNTLVTVYDKDTDGDSIVDSQDNCPLHYNPSQNLSTDPNNCGACGNACTVANGVAACVTANCEIGSCNPTHADCDGLYSTGCEYAISGFANDPQNCGGCGNLCAYPNANGTCTAGGCGMGSCQPGFANCNGSVADGCEYPTSGFASDQNNCGGCGIQCSSGFVCQGGFCQLDTCPPGFADCNGLPADGCEYATSGFQNDPNNCGSCNAKCQPANATGACVVGSCTIAGCNPGWANCNGVAADGCEFATAGFQNDPNNCGGCGTQCQPANATGECTGGACGIASCDPGFADCNGVAADGCEFATSGFQNDPSNCGSCGTQCQPPNGVGVCTGGNCGLASCNPGWVDLDQDPTNGCEYSCVKLATLDPTCDGVDDDCDGALDDEYAPSTCGVGSCAAQGSCVGGVASCTPGAPASEGPAGDPTCSDGADNDCDGDTDGTDPACIATDGGTGGAAGAGGSATGGAAGAGGASGDGSVGGAAGAGGGTGGAGTGGASTGGTGTGGAGTGGASTGGAGTGGSGTGGSGTGGGSGSDGSGDEGGCGCRVVSRSGGDAAGALGLALLGLLTARRRRRAPVTPA